MTNYGDYYHCEICGHVVCILEPGNPPLVCCGEEMSRLEPKTTDQGKEKHVPVIVAEGENTVIKLGSVPHPMTEEHHFCFVEILKKDGKQGRARLNPTGAPEVRFQIKAEDIDTVFAYCNLHGLWKS